ncbi:hypothetical protein WICPIJ_009081 [Wickerhamomyces pijperi]|uniref:Uncharacterized protein n=1 Tax=Wickerhamomyces pijperi TaxID=599730 RepID=A0A9P8TF19_WICPI|nr:hypothetical protein WICPIJ_009081 [Wickerhamomyces pijperi]
MWCWSKMERQNGMSENQNINVQRFQFTAFWFMSVTRLSLEFFQFDLSGFSLHAGGFTFKTLVNLKLASSVSFRASSLRRPISSWKNSSNTAKSGHFRSPLVSSWSNGKQTSPKDELLELRLEEGLERKSKSSSDWSMLIPVLLPELSALSKRLAIGDDDVREPYPLSN